MGRPLRIQFPGALYHVMSRGNERRPIVKDDQDRNKRIDWLRRAVEIYQWKLYAFALVTNHEHLFLETPKPNLSEGMQYLNSCYGGYFNHRHRRTGHLFQGRFKGHLVENRGHYFELSRYLHLNPVRAGLVKSPEDYSWSSYLGYHRQRRQLSWVDYGRILREFGRNSKQARIAYRKFVREGITNPPATPWADATYGLIIGSDAFVDGIRKMVSHVTVDKDVPQIRLLKQRPSLQKIVAGVSQHYGLDRESWKAGRRSDEISRAVAAFLARRCFRYSARETADALGFTVSSSVSRAIRRAEEADKSTQAIIRRLKRKLSDV